MRYIRTIILLLLVSVSAMGQTLKQAGTTYDQATRVTDTTTLSVQSGENFVRIATIYLPATITYMPDTAFGPIPVAIMDGDTLPAAHFFDACALNWAWEIARGEETKIIEISAHENATILVEPFFCPANTSTVVDDAQESYEWYGTVYTESGVYTHENTTEYCAWTDTLHLTVQHLCPANTSTVVDDAQESYEWYGTTYTRSGVYTHENATEYCSWTDTLHLTVHHSCPANTSTVVDDAQESYEWYGTTYTRSGIYTHENATEFCSWTDTLHLTVHHSCPANTSTVVDDAQESYEWYGTTYTRSGVYTHENATEFCSWTDTLHLTIIRNLKDTTLYFCPGMHEEGVVEDDEWRIDYRAYQLEMPSPDWYMEGVIMETQADKALVDFRRAEQNLKEHYQLPFVPITSIVWTFRSADDSESHTMEIKNEPQWVEAGTVSLIVRFLCGAPYYSSFTTDVEQVDWLTQPAKIMENGTVVIIRGGKRYNVLGAKIQ